ncbi:MAG: tetratricopeptide repeat protein [Planctomycetota bacterium]
MNCFRLTFAGTLLLAVIVLLSASRSPAAAGPQDIESIQSDPLLASFSDTRIMTEQQVAADKASRAERIKSIIGPAPDGVIRAAVLPFLTGQIDGETESVRVARRHIAIGIAEVLEVVLRRRWQALPGTSLLPEKDTVTSWERRPTPALAAELFPQRQAILLGTVGITDGASLDGASADAVPEEIAVIDVSLVVRDAAGSPVVHTMAIREPLSQIIRRIDVELMPLIAEKTGIGLSADNVIERLKRPRDNPAAMSQLFIATAAARRPVSGFDTPNVRRDRIEKTMGPMLQIAADSPLALAMYARISEDDDKRAAALDAAIKADPLFVDALVELAIIKRKQDPTVDGLIEAYEGYNEAAKICPNDGALALEQLACLHDLGAFQKRASKIHAAGRLAVQVLPESADAHNDYGAAVLDYGLDAPLAELLFRVALDLDPNHKFAARNLKSALELQGRFDEAIALIRNRAALFADDEALWLDLGRLFDSIGEFASAETAYRRALGLSFLGRRNQFSFALAESRFRAGAFEDAVAVLEAAKAQAVRDEESTSMHVILLTRYRVVGKTNESGWAADIRKNYWRELARIERVAETIGYPRIAKDIDALIEKHPDNYFAHRFRVETILLTPGGPPQVIRAALNESLDALVKAGDPALPERLYVMASESAAGRAAEFPNADFIKMLNAVNLEPANVPMSGDDISAYPPLMFLYQALWQFENETEDNDAHQAMRERCLNWRTALLAE